ncbi:hypothetical protein FC83_GL001300 [Agrilactobacillus composti DSM 18527 = JCM 14202]|uniref:YxjI n=1 Tax=Agrilactobacillus composti DSM 18527 = JCM 14202 TaxID=1423734 RepID=X0PQY5_9LACO|nr:hypothetical protein [Agrilactobacillus composti]KRM35172.1 hypothetical protein FC83_GL001300 [Agrilactobacillus composti DSM 18527 = JCM 14202]GAF40197.1 hypothetical protein JCM14202_2087 [Agrilactobacillus composti DSM 18527 = JCM 14202]
MELYIKKQTTDLKHIALVYDRNKKPVYYVSGRQGLLNDSFTLFQLSGEVIGEIKQVTPGLLPRFDIIIDKQTVGSLKRLIGVWHQFIFVSDLRWLLMGDLLDNHYQAFAGGQLIFQVDTVMLSDGAMARELVIHDPDVAPICILIAMVLDLWSRNTKKHHAKSPIVTGGLLWND